MTLYEMLDVTLYYQPVKIFSTNAYDQNIILFDGEVNEARADVDVIWNYLMNKIDRYEIRNDKLYIFVQSEYYDYRLEEKEYKELAKHWTKYNRPWLFSYEIREEM